MGAKGLILSAYIGIAIIAIMATIFVLIGLQWKGGNEGVPLFLFGVAALCLFAFIIYWTKSPLARWGARLAVSAEEGKTVDDGLELFKTYSPILLAAAVVAVIGGVAALLRY